MPIFLDFEKPIAELEEKIAELQQLSGNNGVSIADEVRKLQLKAEKMLKQTYGKLTAWQKTQVARHPERPHLKDYCKILFPDLLPLAGDRYFGEDQAIIGGIATFHERSVMIIGHEKGSDTSSRMRHNFGMALPEGYRKARRLMEMADRFGLPIITLVDTPGAYPGVEAEARGQAEAIAKSIETCLRLRVPIISVVIGEGGSGGAIALASANKVFMLENAIYSVISPEGCASILWRSANYSKEAAEALKLTADDLLQLRVIDGIIPEPLGGAHRQPEQTIQSVGQMLQKTLDELYAKSLSNYQEHRQKKFLAIGHGF
ncbi:MAG TPA: acetyl-CoA carboxylase carboxyltransferase subunit alpha [Alphaproteobacteria bacterium]|nr:acetyl-CoA carboxylase carboxyltransferase subunit alpha [Alphaproteobacteria bacterium]